MFRRSLRLPITLAVMMIVLIVALTVGWILIIVLKTDTKMNVMWVTLLSAGTTSLVLVLLGTVLYLVLSVKAINLSARQSNFIDSVTHELKSPIASLKLYLQTLSRHNVDEQQRADFYAYMLDDVERLDHLINHILQAARLDRTTPAEETQLVDLASLIEATTAKVCLRHQVDRSIVKVHTQPCWLAASQVDVELIFRNLIDNAIKYSGDPPEVAIQIKNMPGGRAIVTIEDNGPGVPKKQRRKIFARFVRLGSELQRKKPGTGLGLFIVRTLVARLKGRIRVVENEDRAGTTFEVELRSAQSVPPTEPRLGQAPAQEKVHYGNGQSRSEDHVQNES
ncbi:MAG: HAMP domain-containing sensor histidine kinase [Planctomycetota bacterium]